MKKEYSSVIALLVIIGFITSSIVKAEAKDGADDSAAPQTPNATIPSSGADFTGDEVYTVSTMYHLKRVHDNSTDWIAPMQTRFLVIQGAGDTFTVLVQGTPCIYAQNKNPPVESKGWRWYRWFPMDCKNLAIEDKDFKMLVKENQVYAVGRNDLIQHGYFRTGVVYGALLVPYKYFFHDKSLSSGSTIGAFIGSRWGSHFWDIAPIVSVGLSSLTVGNPNGSGDTSTLQGISFAIGVIGGVNKNDSPMNFGVLLGRDYAGSNSAVPYEHEGKTWIAASIGFNFSK